MGRGFQEAGTESLVTLLLAQSRYLKGSDRCNRSWEERRLTVGGLCLGSDFAGGCGGRDWVALYQVAPKRTQQIAPFLALALMVTQGLQWVGLHTISTASRVMDSSHLLCHHTFPASYLWELPGAKEWCEGLRRKHAEGGL